VKCEHFKLPAPSLGPPPSKDGAVVATVIGADPAKLLAKINEKK
jgi:hypothetical protein